MSYLDVAVEKWIERLEAVEPGFAEKRIEVRIGGMDFEIRWSIQTRVFDGQSFRVGSYELRGGGQKKADPPLYEGCYEDDLPEGQLQFVRLQTLRGLVDAFFFKGAS